MFFFFIGGARPRIRDLDRPERRIRFCPSCGETRQFQEKSVRTYLELFFVPILPLGQGRRIWVCERCGFQIEFDEAELTSTYSGARGAAATGRGARTRGAAGDPSGRHPADRPASEASETRSEATRLVHCVHCGAAIHASADRGWKKLVCSRCGRDFEVRL